MRDEGREKMKLVSLVVEQQIEDDDPFREPSAPAAPSTPYETIEHKMKKLGVLIHHKEMVDATVERLKRAGDVVPGYAIPGHMEKQYVQYKLKFKFGVLLNAKPEVHRVMSRCEQEYEKYKLARIDDKLVELERQKRRLERADAQKALSASKQSTPAFRVPISQIPQKITTSSARFQNPYFAGLSERYAGSPEHYAWTPQMARIFEIIKQALARNGLGPFSVIYASRMNGQCFAAIGANGELVWRKYDPSPGAGANWMYIGKQRINTSAFTSVDQAAQDALLAPLKPKTTP